MGSIYGKHTQVKQNFTSLETSVESISFNLKTLFTWLGSFFMMLHLETLATFICCVQHIVDAEIFPTVTLNNTTEIAVYSLKLYVYNHIKHNTHNPTNALGKTGLGFFTVELIQILWKDRWDVKFKILRMTY